MFEPPTLRSPPCFQPPLQAGAAPPQPKEAKGEEGKPAIAVALTNGDAGYAARPVQPRLFAEMSPEGSIERTVVLDPRGKALAYRDIVETQRALDEATVAAFVACRHQHTQGLAGQPTSRADLSRPGRVIAKRPQRVPCLRLAAIDTHRRHQRAPPKRRGQQQEDQAEIGADNDGDHERGQRKRSNCPRKLGPADRRKA